ncbi:hypothetical protein [Prosthecobacter sp.]|uniref:hypothetical protein n=1 Tax=Prosthecobacter sp. TaxID=1965333 RepID=UPI0037847086
MPVDSSSFNILEQLVSDQIARSGGTTAPRLLVRRQSIDVSSFGQWFTGVADRPDYPIKELLQSREATDWAPFFHLDSRANLVEREMIELEFDRYCELRRDSHQQIVFSFSASVPTDEGHMLYCTADRGFLWAWGFLCTYSGSFESPTTLSIVNVWRS